MQQALLQERIADVARLILIQSLALREDQACGAMRIPRRLESTAEMSALAQREPDAVAA
jgi:hypothetical protein